MSCTIIIYLNMIQMSAFIVLHVANLSNTNLIKTLFWFGENPVTYRLGSDSYLTNGDIPGSMTAQSAEGMANIRPSPRQRCYRHDIHRPDDSLIAKIYIIRLGPLQIQFPKSPIWIFTEGSDNLCSQHSPSPPPC